MGDFAHLLLLLGCLVRLSRTDTELPSYAHLHTSAQIEETREVLLDKVNVCHRAQYNRSQLLVAIKSAAGNIAQRRIVRQTWLADVTRHGVPHVFILGSAVNNVSLRVNLLAEDDQHEDLLIGRFVDGYYNLTLKSMFVVGWAKMNCPNRWLFYVDDDVIMNVQNVVRFMSSVDQLARRALFCHRGHRLVHREPQSKYFVSRSIWPPDEFPKYCYGWAYLIPPDVVPLLHEAATDRNIQPKLWLEDVFMTGIAAKAAGVQVAHSSFVCCRRRKRDYYEKNLVLGEMGKGKELLESWKLVRSKAQPSGSAHSRVASIGRWVRIKRIRPKETTATLTLPLNDRFLLICITSVLLIVLLVNVFLSRQFLFRLVGNFRRRR